MTNSNKIKLEIKLPLTVLKQGKYFVAYTPALDLSTSAQTFDEVKERFEEVVVLFLEELLEMGTLDDVLSTLGWTKIRRKWRLRGF